jgi:hypothetical protein
MPFLTPSFARLLPLELPARRPGRGAPEGRPQPGVSRRALQRYQAGGNASRAVYLALWFESRWGRATQHAQAYNAAQHAAP